MTILEALSDPNLFGALPSFHDLKTWSAWRAFLAAVYGLPMAEAELESSALTPAALSTAAGRIWRSCRDRRAAVWQEPGRGDALATFEAIRAPREPARKMWARLIAQDQRSALRTLFDMRLSSLRGCADASSVWSSRGPPTRSSLRTA